VAILKHGRLAHAGSLDDLRERETALIEVIVTGADAATMNQHLESSAKVTTTASGLRIAVVDEKEVDHVISALRKANGKLVSVQPVRQSLEDLILK
jgi:ABC-type multidrug transport system ATPase subunit